MTTSIHPVEESLTKTLNPYQPIPDLWPHMWNYKITYQKHHRKRNLILLISCCRPKRMRGSLSGRSWLWAVSLTMGQASTPAAARAANPAYPHGKTSKLCHIYSFLTNKHVTGTFLESHNSLKKGILKGDGSRCCYVKISCIQIFFLKWLMSQAPIKKRQTGRKRMTGSREDLRSVS